MPSLDFKYPMEFASQAYVLGETIAAVATPPGEGGVAIIRISGDRAVEVVQKTFSGSIHRYQSHTAHTGKLRNARGEHIDDVLLLVMHAPRSYTGETTVEVHCHGGTIVTRRVLETILAAGARAALPGEFTFRAFINGKMDLAQAEGVQAVIGARNERALNAAEHQLKGELSRSIISFQQRLTDVAAILNAWVDFPEEGLEFATFEEINEQLEQLSQQMEALLDTFHDGKIIEAGLSICLVGCPNVGKSSLLNALLDKERAIVSPLAGTTRDVLEDHLRLNGLNLKVSDTAGIRETEEGIEQEGIRRSKITMQQADLILWVLDASLGMTPDDHHLLSLVPPHKTIGVWNKIDLSHHSLPSLPLLFTVQLSAKERLGLKALHQAIDRLIWTHGVPSKEEVVLTNTRHWEALAASIAATRRVQEGLENGLSPEFLTLDMREALNELGKILGTNVTEDILSAIFSRFCIGK